MYFERVFPFFILISGVGAVVYVGGSTLEIVCGISNIVCVVLTALGYRASFYIGIVASVSYGLISYENAIYGDAALNFIYFLPMQIYGIYSWIKGGATSEGKAVEVRSLSARQLVRAVIFAAIFIAVCAVILYNVRGRVVLLDSATTVLQIFAAYLLAARYREQWYCWIGANILSIVMWCILPYIHGGEMVAGVVVMWCVFLMNSCLGLYIWTKRSAR